MCVKNYQLDGAIADIKNFVGKETVILPLLNGVTARDRLLDAYPGNRVLYGLSIAIAAQRADRGVTNTVDGVIQFGDADNTEPADAVLAVRDFLAAAGIKTEVCPDMIRACWKKWMFNGGCNQVSALTDATYGQMISVEPNRVLFHEAMLEVVALAKASGIRLDEQDALDFEKMLETFSPLGRTSMLQDMQGKRRTEVDSFAGTVMEFGKKLRVPTPVNHVLYCIIKSREELGGSAG